VKIAFIGTHGVGKTTLCFELAAALKRRDLSVDMVKEVARSCPLPINQQTTLAAQSWILHTQIAWEIEAAERYEIVICDRSVLDNYAYLVHRLGHVDYLDAMVKGWLATYDHLFKVPIVGRPSFDGTRDVSLEFQRGIDDEVERLIAHFGVRPHRLDPTRRAVWTKDILKVVTPGLVVRQESLFREEDGESGSSAGGS
jgi:nicotinamide riboside kinase